MLFTIILLIYFSTMKGLKKTIQENIFMKNLLKYGFQLYALACLGDI